MEIVADDLDTLKLAEEAKVEGNTHFKNALYFDAEQAYSRAIELVPNNAVYLSNRAFCNLKLENYGLAIADATKAIESNPKYVKAYYRKGAAFLAMGKYKDGLKLFNMVLKMYPKDKDALAKKKMCEKEVRAAAFLKAIAGERQKPMSETTDWKEMDADASYTGPRYEGENITPDFINELIEHFRNQKRLHRRYVYRILLEMIKLLSGLPTLVDIAVPPGNHITVCGDVHGQFYDLLNIFQLNGLPSESNPYLFNGDFVDRGSFSLEIIVLFFALKLCYPGHFHMTRGNHESRTMNQIYGFQGEVCAKVDTPAFELFSEAFNFLPLAACIGEKILVVHGGLFSEDGVTIDDIRKIDRNRQPPESGLMCELLWSDPQPMNGRAPSKRGVGLSFGPDVTQRFLEHNNLDLVIRSHEVKMNGYEVEAGGKLVTVFSAPNYCDSMGNKGAFIRFENDLKPQFTSFSHVPHPPVAPMAYASPMYR